MRRFSAVIVTAAVVLVLLLALVFLPGGKEEGDPAAAIAPYLDEQAVAVLYVDARRLDAQAAFDKLAELMKKADPEAEEDDAELKEGREQVKEFSAFRDKFTGVGARDVFLVVTSAEEPFLIVPVGKGANVEAIRALIFSGELDGPVSGERSETLPFVEVCEQLGDVVFAGTKQELERLRSLKAVRRPAFTEAFAAVSGTTAQIIAAPTEKTRADLQERMSALPLPFPGGLAPDMTGGMKWLAVGVNGPPAMRLKVAVKCNDAAQAEAIRDEFAKSFEPPPGVEVPKEMREQMEPMKVLVPKVAGARLVLDLNDRQLNDLFLGFLPALARARREAQKASSLNNVHMLLLGCALHQNDQGKWPEGLSVLFPEYFESKDMLKSPRRLGARRQYVYLRPPAGADPMRMVIYEAHDAWPEGGLVVGFVDGHVETVRQQARFKRLLREAGAER